MGVENVARRSLGTNTGNTKLGIIEKSDIGAASIVGRESRHDDDDAPTTKGSSCARTADGWAALVSERRRRYARGRRRWVTMPGTRHW